MWQRKQTVLLVVVSVLMMSGVFLPLWSKSEGTVMVRANYFVVQKIENGQLQTSVSVFYIGVLCLISSVVSLFSVLKFQDRILQLKLGMLNSFLLTLVLVLVVFATVKGNELLQSDDNGDFQIGFYVPGLAMVINWLANRFIKKDEQLVKDAFERLR